MIRSFNVTGLSFNEKKTKEKEKTHFKRKSKNKYLFNFVVYANFIPQNIKIEGDFSI